MMGIINFFIQNPILLWMIIVDTVVILIWSIKNYKLLFSLYKKYEEIVNYLIAGALTTFISIASYALFVFLLKPFFKSMTNITISTILSWIVAVIFAYFVNKVFVFKTKTSLKETLKEGYEFIKYRIVSLLLDIALMWLFVSLLKMPNMLAKIIDQVAIVIVNYTFSKLFIFVKKGKTD